MSSQVCEINYLVLYHQIYIKNQYMFKTHIYITKVKLDQIKVDMNFRPKDGLSNDFDDLEQQNMKPRELLDQMVSKVTVTDRRDTDLSKRKTSPQNPRNDSKSKVKLSSEVPHPFSQKHTFMRLDNQPYLITCNIQNPTLASSLEKVQLLFNKALTERGIRTFDLSYELVRNIYTTSSELKHEFSTLYKAMKYSNVQDCIELAQVLDTKLWYFEDLYKTAPLWAEFEFQVQLNLKILTFKEKVKAFHRLGTFGSNNVSSEFKHRFEHNLLQSDFTKLTLDEVLMFKAASKGSSKSELASKQFIFDLIHKQPDIVGIQSQVGLDIAYTYFSNNLLSEQRKNGVTKEQQKEEERQVMEILHQPISRAVKLMTDSDLLRLAKLLGIIKANSYPELDTRITRDILLRIEDIEPDVLLSILFRLTNNNNRRGIGDKKFWNKVSHYILNNFDKFDGLHDQLFFCELFELLAYHERLSFQDYQRLFRTQILKWLQSKSLSVSHIAPLFNGVMCLDLAFQNTQIIQDDLNSIVTSIFSQDKLLSTRNYQTLKIMHMYAQANHPSLNLKVLDRFLDQAVQSSSLDKFRNKQNQKSGELNKVMNFVKGKLDPEMVPVYNDQGAFLIDLANTNLKFAIYLRTPKHILSSSIFGIDFRTIYGRILPERQLQMDILRTQGWHVYELNYLNFIHKGDDRVDWLQEILKNELKKAEQNREVVNKETRLGS